MKETTLSMNANKAWKRFMEKFSNAPENLYAYIREMNDDEICFLLNRIFFLGTLEGDFPGSEYGGWAYINHNSENPIAAFGNVSMAEILK